MATRTTPPRDDRAKQRQLRASAIRWIKELVTLAVDRVLGDAADPDEESETLRENLDAVPREALTEDEARALDREAPRVVIEREAVEDAGGVERYAQRLTAFLLGKGRHWWRDFERSGLAGEKRPRTTDPRAKRRNDHKARYDGLDRRSRLFLKLPAVARRHIAERVAEARRGELDVSWFVASDEGRLGADFIRKNAKRYPINWYLTLDPADRDDLPVPPTLAEAVSVAIKELPREIRDEVNAARRRPPNRIRLQGETAPRLEWPIPTGPLRPRPPR